MRPPSILTQVAKTRRALFVEGKDFQLLSAFAETAGYPTVANRAQFAVLPANGFNPARVGDVADGIEAAVGSKILRAAVFDRDYRCDAEVEAVDSRGGPAAF